MCNEVMKEEATAWIATVISVAGSWLPTALIVDLGAEMSGLQKELTDFVKDKVVMEDGIIDILFVSKV